MSIARRCCPWPQEVEPRPGTGGFPPPDPRRIFSQRGSRGRAIAVNAPFTRIGHADRAVQAGTPMTVKGEGTSHAGLSSGRGVQPLALSPFLFAEISSGGGRRGTRLAWGADSPPSGLGVKQTALQRHAAAAVRAGLDAPDGGTLLWQRRQNSTPACALMPARNGCFTSVISVTRSAASISFSDALRPVSTTWVSGGFSAARKPSTSSISR